MLRHLIPTGLLLLLICALVASRSAAAGASLVVNRMIAVAATGTPTENCQGLLSTLDGIQDASETLRYVVHLEPGKYNCGDNIIVMKSWVDLEGSGQESTLVFSMGTGGHMLEPKADSEVRQLTLQNEPPLAGGDIRGVESSESFRMSDVTIRVGNSSFILIGMAVSGGANPVLTNVTIEVDGQGAEQVAGLATFGAAPVFSGVRVRVTGGDWAVGILADGNDAVPPTLPVVIRDVDVRVHDALEGIGIRNEMLGDPPVEILSSTIRASGIASNVLHAVYNLNSSAVVSASHLFAGYDDSLVPPVMGTSPPLGSANDGHGIYNHNESPMESLTYEVQVDNCRIVADHATVRNDAKFTTRVGGSLMSGGDVMEHEEGELKCAGVWDEATAFYDAICPGATPPG